MANQEHVDRLLQGVEAWNRWREEHNSGMNYNDRPDLRDANLHHADLRSANLSHADLRDADLSRADLRYADLRSADLRYVNFNYADLRSADLSHAGLKNANLSRADLSRADLRYADLSHTDLQGANLRDANLRGANLSYTDLGSADLQGVSLSDTTISEETNLDDKWRLVWRIINEGTQDIDLRGIDLSYADLSGIDLSSADLQGTNLSSAYLQGAKLRDANLRGGNLNSANLSGANLSGADLSTVQALQASFQMATLTGACVEDWNINSGTNLQDVVCEYIFTKSNQVLTEPMWDENYTDRLPHDLTKTFASGDFAKLVQQSLNTVNLIFREGLDWRSFAYSFQQLQVQYADEQIAIQNIENKGDGTVVVKLAVAPDADKGSIEQSFWRGFEMAQKAIAGQYESRLEDKDKHINQLFTLLQQSQEELGKVPKLMAENLKSETYNTTVHGPVGNLANRMQGNAAQHATQNIGANLNEITTLIQSLRTQAESFPQAQRTEAIDHLEDIETELKQPPEQRKKNRIKAALVMLVGIATAISGAVAGANEFATQVQELSDKLGIPLPIEQVQPQLQEDAVDVRAIEQE